MHATWIEAITAYALALRTGDYPATPDAPSGDAA